MSHSLPEIIPAWECINKSSIPYYGKLSFPYYHAQVVGTSVDCNRAGSVQVRVKGVTDNWEDKLQPWVAPELTNGMQQVPQKGQWLLVKFLDGDINQGVYFGMSQTTSFLPTEYVEQYPDVAVLNLGESSYLYTHNRRSHISTVKNPGNRTDITWNEAGEISVSSSNAAAEAGNEPVSVLTETTIDIFTCMPIGSPDTGVRAGSEYLRVPHISQATIDALRGTGSGMEVAVKAVQDAEVDGVEKKQLVGTESTYSVHYMESPAAKNRNSKKNKRIVIGATMSSPFAVYLHMFTHPGATVSAHYIVGVADGNPDIMSELDDMSKAKNLGFIQCVEIENDGTYGSDDPRKLNIDAVSVVFYGDGTLNTYQQKKLADIANHVKKASGLAEIEVVAASPKSEGNKKKMQALENLKQYEGMY